ncbi:GyrI-like domain-containing protein [Georgenia sunbinii]|uniref:GyrI-like domain-containing protein n=1 Tax=Georgenia sunbinii TaxID=3117728 RepID=UPI002F266699
MTPEIIQLPEVATAAVRDTIPMTELAGFFDRSFGLLATVLAEQGASPTGPAYARYFGLPGDTVDVELGYPVAEVIRRQGEVYAASLAAPRVVRAVHEGSYDQLGDSWRALWEWIVARGLNAADEMWEVYVTEPTPDGDPAAMRTELSWPLRD